MSYRFTDQADEALTSIIHFIALDNERAALRVYEQVIETCETLADMPGLGRHPEFSNNPEIRYFPVKKYQNYLVVYRKSRKGIAIVDVIHGARDLPNLIW